MFLELTDKDAQLLGDLLRAYLPEFKREVSRTEVKAMRHELLQRQELCERLLDRLSREPAGAYLP